MVIICSAPALAKRYRLEAILFRQPILGMDNETWRNHPVMPERKANLPQAEAVKPRELNYVRKRLEAKTLILAQRAWEFEDDQPREINLQEDGSAYRLFGNIEIKPGHYFSLKTHLMLEMLKEELPHSISKQFEEETVTFPLVDSRKIISDKTYYYDHPIFGMLVKIKEVKV